MTTALVDRWPALRTLNAALPPGRWAATFFAVALGQFVFWVALLHLLVGDRERVERLVYFVSFTLLPLISSLITFGGAWIAQRAGRDPHAFSDGLIAFNLSLALVLGILARGEYFNPDSLPLGLLLSLVNDAGLSWDVSGLAQAVRQTAQALPPLVLVIYGLGHGLLLVSPKLVRPRLAHLGVVSASLGVVLLSAAPSALAIHSLPAPAPAQIRVDQARGLQISFDWQMDGPCMDYAFSAAGAQAIWLGELGLASVNPINYGRLCADVPQILRIIIDDGTEHIFVVGSLQTSLVSAWFIALACGLIVLPLLSLGLGGALVLALLGLLALFLGAFTPSDVDPWPILIGAGAGSAMLVLLPWRVGRWFDLAFALLIIGLTVNLGFPYDQFHYHSGWLGTVSAMLHGQTLMIDVFSQRGFLSMVALAAVFSVLPLTYPMFSLLIGGLLAAQFLVVYALLKWAGVGRWWAACAVLLGIAIYSYKLYFHMTSLPGFSPLRLGHIFLLALAVGWRLRTDRRSARWIEWGVLVFCVLWSLDTALICLAGYAALLTYEAWNRYGTTRAGMVWLGQRALRIVGLVSLAFVLANGWIWLSTGQAARWDIYLEFFRYHEDLQAYQRPISFWSDGWWLSIVPQFAALMVLAWRAFTGQASKTWRSESLIVLIAAGGVVQFYHYISQSLYPHNHIVPAAVSLAYLGHLLPWGKLWRWVGLALVGVVWAFYGPNIDPGPGLDSPPLVTAVVRIGQEALQGRRDTLDWIEFRWASFGEGQYNNRGLMVDSPALREAIALIGRYSPGEQRPNLYLGRDTWQALLMMGAAHRYPFTFPPHDSRLEALAQQIATHDGRETVGDMLYLSPTGLAALPRFWREVHPITPFILDRLCRQFDFELLETSPHGVMAIRLRESSGQNAICEEHGLYWEGAS
ncbi:MAG: hypothetical protein NZ750_03020 [Anaerolineae bacterium]|nr:hypothetical protein [Anaerolineae bacterium]MDW8172729.1 hypothetical protein [Anaerolineae bacterium]